MILTVGTLNMDGEGKAVHKFFHEAILIKMGLHRLQCRVLRPLLNRRWRIWAPQSRRQWWIRQFYFITRSDMFLYNIFARPGAFLWRELWRQSILVHICYFLSTFFLLKFYLGVQFKDLEWVELASKSSNTTPPPNGMSIAFGGRSLVGGGS
jgi:hypothetical protein